MQIRINTHGGLPEQHGDWIDLYAAQNTVIEAGQDRMISLGVSMEIPEGYEAHVLPRSSTFQKYGIMLVNGTGIIDNDYKGDDDVWHFHAYAVRLTYIPAGERIAQFRIVPKQPKIEFVPVDSLGNPNRGGFGSTGR